MKQSINQSLVAEKPKYLRHKVGGFIIEVTLLEGDIFDGIIVECNEHSTLLKKGEKRTDLNVKYFEPCDYTPSLEDLIEKDRQANQNKPFCGFEFSPEPVEIEHPIKGVNTDINRNPITAKGSADWLPRCNSNETPLTPYGLYVQKLEQENAQLKADNLKARDYTVELSELLGKSQITIAELEAQLTAKNELLSNTEQLPVYNADWLNSLLQSQYGLYSFCEENKRVFIAAIDENQKHHDNYYLDPKTSADMIIRAVAKEFNGNKVGTQIIYWMPDDLEYDFLTTNPDNNWGCPLFVNAKKAIDILNQIDPQILKNYFA